MLMDQTYSKLLLLYTYLFLFLLLNCMLRPLMTLLSAPIIDGSSIFVSLIVAKSPALLPPMAIVPEPFTSSYWLLGIL